MIPTGQKLLKVVSELNSKKIAVFGDLILDQYTWSEIGRISPEAPIPVALVKDIEYRGGGAACTALNLLALENQVSIFGIIGQDFYGNQLNNLLKDAGADTEGLIIKADYQTTLKNRVLTHQQQIIRIDLEKIESINEADEQNVIKHFQKNIQSFSAVLISDYSKGFLSVGLIKTIIEISNEFKIPVIVDP